MLRPGCRRIASTCAPLLLAVLLCHCALVLPLRAQDGRVHVASYSDEFPLADVEMLLAAVDESPMAVPSDPPSVDSVLLLPSDYNDGATTVPPSAADWRLAPEDDGFALDDCPTDDWCWQWTPTGLIYHSYMAGPNEPRMSFVSFYDGDNHAFWDATLGARVGFLRYGDRNAFRPQGYQLDFYGAAISRLDVEHRQDLVATDYVFGFPLTYGVNEWQFKFGYAHVSSHLGDEEAIREPDQLDERINYVRDGLVFGISRYPYPFWRQYAEIGWAFHTSGGAEPIELQFGSEFSAPGPTDSRFIPFVAVNGHLREEQSFGGDFALQTGWLRRGEYGQTLRFGLHFYTGKSSQMQFFNQSEEQLGLGIWYDL